MIRLITRIAALIFSLGIIALMILPMLPWVAVPAYDLLSETDFPEDNLQPSYTLIDEIISGGISTFTENANPETSLIDNPVFGIVRNILRIGFIVTAVLNIVLIILLIITPKWAKYTGIFIACFSLLLGVAFIVGIYLLNLLSLIGIKYNTNSMNLMQPTIFVFIFIGAVLIQGILTRFVYKKALVQEPEYEIDTRRGRVSAAGYGVATGTRYQNPNFTTDGENYTSGHTAHNSGYIRDDSKLRNILAVLIILIMILIITLSVILFSNVIRAFFNS